MDFDTPLIFISFRVGRLGGVMAEYAEDKLRVLEKLGITTLVVTSLASLPNDRKGVRYYRIPSISWSEFSKQINSLKIRNQPVPWPGLFFYPVSFTLGRLFDKFLLKKLSSSPGGNWSWSLMCLPVVFFLSLKYRIRGLFATGSASAGLVGAVVFRALKAQFFYEIPDPLIGSTMARNPLQLKRIRRLERFLIQNSSRTVFNSNVAASDAIARNQDLADKIYTIYPGAWVFPHYGKEQPRSKFTFVHLGSLYGSRNLDLFFSALEHVIEEDSLNSSNFQVVNVGHMNEDQVNHYSSVVDFISIPNLEREQAIEFAINCNVLLLIQHEDSRSAESIPFKIYDYLNLNLPIISILDNSEILDLLGEYSELASKIKDLDRLKESIRKSLAWDTDKRDAQESSIDSTQQFLSILEGKAD
jgi:hypothetical protein